MKKKIGTKILKCVPHEQWKKRLFCVSMSSLVPEVSNIFIFYFIKWSINLISEIFFQDSENPLTI